MTTQGGIGGAARAVRPTERSTVRRLPARGSHERDVIDAILDEALVCHLGIAGPDGPVVLPTLFVRIGDELILHGSASNAMLRSLKAGAPACCTVTLVDGLVLARSSFHHSVNYRSVVVFGEAKVISERRRKLAAFEALVDKVVPGRFEDARKPTEKEIRATLVIALPLTEASAKVRTGPPLDDEEDYSLPVWAGVIPIHLQHGGPVADSGPEVPAPARLLSGRWAAPSPGAATDGVPGY